MTTAATLESLTDRQAIRVLALAVDRQQPLPDPTRLREIAQATADPELDESRQPNPTPPTPGELTRATLGHLATADPTSAQPSTAPHNWPTTAPASPPAA